MRVGAFPTHVGVNRAPVELARNLKCESVSRLHPTPPLAVTPEQTVAEAVALMRRHGTGCVLVCRDDRLAGIFTERDLLRRVLAAGRPLTEPVAACMTADPVVVHPKDPINAAIRQMEEGGYRHLPVVDHTGRPLGVLSIKRIVHYLVEHYLHTIYNQPPDPGAYPPDPRGPEQKGSRIEDRRSRIEGTNSPLDPRSSILDPRRGGGDSMKAPKPGKPRRVPVEERESATVRLAGDSGDGMQLAGARLTHTAALLGNDVSTLPDFPAEIRAPAGSLAGVSGFQVQFASADIHTPGDRLDALVAMNPAALKTNLPDLEPGGILLVNQDAFTAADLGKAGYAANPLEDGSLQPYRLVAVPMTRLNREALAGLELSLREADRCRNFFALGLVCWLYERPLGPTLRWIRTKFAGNLAVREANSRALKAGYNYGGKSAALPVHYRIPKAPIPPGRYRKVTGNEALALGLVAAAQLAGLPLLYAGYPITPASDILHLLADLKRFGVRTFQAEDEIAAAGAALGAAFGGGLGVTATSGPGLCLKSEAIGLAVMVELPVVVIDVQRGGPSTGLPTKTEQADLLQALFGRNGECPVAVVAPCSPSDCFAMTLEAVRLAVGFMTPVLFLSDGYLAQGAEPWRIPDVAELPKIPVHFAGPGTEDRGSRIEDRGSRAGDPRSSVPPEGGTTFFPYNRDRRLVRPWAVPGTPGLEHRLGGLEKEDGSGNVSYDPHNHEHMTRTRARKIANIAQQIPDLVVTGPAEGDLLVVGWGGTYGAIVSAVQRAQRRGLSVAHAHLRYLNPMPRNTADVLRRYRTVLVPELNAGQLRLLLRAEFLVDAVGLNKVQGRPFLIREIEEKIEELVCGP